MVVEHLVTDRAVEVVITSVQEVVKFLVLMIDCDNTCRGGCNLICRGTCSGSCNGYCNYGCAGTMALF